VRNSDSPTIFSAVRGDDETHITTRRRNRVYKSLHKPLTYSGSSGLCFYFVCRWRVGVFTFSIASSPELPSSSVARIRHWVTNTDPGSSTQLASRNATNVRYDPAKQKRFPAGRWSDAATR